MPVPALARLDAAALDALHGRSMLLTQDWSTPEIETLCTLAETLQQLDREGTRPAAVRAAAVLGAVLRQLHADQVVLGRRRGALRRASRSSWTARPPRSATARRRWRPGAMLGMNAHALGIRHDLILGEGNRFMRDAKQGIDDYLAATGDERVVPVVNLQCDIDHPTQALADLLWLRERFPDGLAGRTITMSLGLLAQLRQAAVGGAGRRHAADPLRGATSGSPTPTATS